MSLCETPVVPAEIPGDQPKNGDRLFTTTHWSVVLALGDSDSPQASEALEVLCKTYWYPLYAYLRRRGWNEQDAQDQVQGLFAQLMQRRSLERVAPERGKFRSFLLAALNHFVQDQRDREQAAKRGGNCEFLELDGRVAESRYQLEPREIETPESLFQRTWAVAVLDETMRRLSAESDSSENPMLCEQLLGLLTKDKANATYAAIATRFCLSESAIKMAMLRLRRRYRELLRTVISETVTGREETEEELRHLFQVFSR